MALIVIPNVFSAGAVIVASQHNSNFSVIAADYNGNIDNTNIATNAAIAYSKLTLTGLVSNADLAGSIADSKLSTISTAGKVSGASLTALSSIPSGAGKIPVINLASGTASSSTYYRGDQTFVQLSLGLSLVSATSFSGAATSGNISIDSTKMYLVKVVLTAQSANQSLWIRVNADTAANYGYYFTGINFLASGTSGSSNFADTKIATSQALAISTDKNANMTFNIFPQSTASSNYLNIVGKTMGTTAANSGIALDFYGIWGGGAAATSFQILPSTGTITGTVYLYSFSLS